MSAISPVIIDITKISNLHSGLGQYCNYLHIHTCNYYKEAQYYTKDNNLLGNNYIQYKPLHKLVKYKPNAFLWHATHQNNPILPAKHTPLLLTVHDLNFLYKYKGIKQKIYFKRFQNLVKRTDQIVCISNFVKQDLLKNMNYDTNKIHVIYNGNCLNTHLKATKPNGFEERPFLLSMGLLSEKKNIESIIKCMLFVKDFSLVIAGSGSVSSTNALKQLVIDHHLQKRVFFTGSVSEEEKLWLYQNCEAFLFPSFSEGFGLPVIEAMSCGKPVFTSNLTSLPEIGAGLTYLWQKFDPDYMAEIIETGLNNFANNVDLLNNVKLHAAKFTWENTVKQYIKIYKQYT